MALGTQVYTSSGGSLDTVATIGPTSGIVAGTTPLNAVGTNQGDQLGITNNIISALVALENVVGIVGSAVTTSHDYKIKKAPFVQFQAALDYSPPATLYGVFGVQNNRPHLAFNDSATWTALYFGIVPLTQLFASGLIVRLKWKSITVTTGNAVWGVAIERLNTAESADSFDTQVTATTACSGTQSALVETAITITTIDSIAAGDGFGLQVQRLGANGSDTLVGDACLRLISIESA